MTKIKASTEAKMKSRMASVIQDALELQKNVQSYERCEVMVDKIWPRIWPQLVEALQSEVE